MLTSHPAEARETEKWEGGLEVESWSGIADTLHRLRPGLIDKGNTSQARHSYECVEENRTFYFIAQPGP